MRCKLCHKRMESEDLIVDPDYCLDCIDFTEGDCLGLPKGNGLLLWERVGNALISLHRISLDEYTVQGGFRSPYTADRLTKALKEYRLIRKGLLS
jgi:hypothetical protein